MTTKNAKAARQLLAPGPEWQLPTLIQLPEVRVCVHRDSHRYMSKITSFHHCIGWSSSTHSANFMYARTYARTYSVTHTHARARTRTFSVMLSWTLEQVKVSLDGLLKQIQFDKARCWRTNKPWQFSPAALRPYLPSLSLCALRSMRDGAEGTGRVPRLWQDLLFQVEQLLHDRQ